MPVYSDSFDENIVLLLKKGGIGVVRTDTLYGLVAVANNDVAVERVFAVKHRTYDKSPIVMISRLDQLFDGIDASISDRLVGLWPGKNSIILPSHRAPDWITRGKSSVAYRLPDDERLRDLIDKTGPLVAPSANPEGLPPAMNIDEAKGYFGDSVDFYVDGGTVTDDTPSRLYTFAGSTMERLR
ncbi:MAG TPA: L-threonylcarbamoyladenylate synthase [Candidatus Saccharimonadales bacterium]|nr:L-threonylcarbamoyladenylate synthase [Candidatus Saccharimonadales bacterium]